MSQEIENNFEERKKDWDLTGLLDDVIRRYIYQLTNDELNEINLEKASGMPDEAIKNGIKLPLATMQHQNTTPESPEAEHQQAKMENLMDISLPLVDQEPFQEILQALLKNDMSQAANLLQYLGSHLDKLQEEHQKMQVEFRELKEQVNSIDERFFNDSDSVDTVQNNLDQSEKLITLNKSRLANVVLQTKSKLKTAGKNALLSFAEKIHVPKALASLQKGMQHTQDSLDVLFQRLNDAKQAVQDVSNSVKNVGRALTGKELLEYVPWDPEKGKIASVQRKIYAMERTLGNLQERTNTLLSKMQRPEQKPEKQVKKDN